MSLLRIPILLAGALSVWKAFTPPHTSSQTERIPITIVGRFAVSFVPFMKIAHAFSCLSETALILASNYPNVTLAAPLISTLTTRLSLDVADLIMSPPFLTGSILVIVGAQLRLACYRSLGRLFTFEMAIRKGHRLIRTGPYSYVRHPAYVGLIMTMVGAVVVEGSEGSWLMECSGFGYLVTRTYLLLLASSVLLISLGIFRRSINEDQALKEAFGEEWSHWAKETPYRMIPYVY